MERTEFSSLCGGTTNLVLPDLTIQGTMEWTTVVEFSPFCWRLIASRLLGVFGGWVAMLNHAVELVTTL
jgi:hypothetical protein